eukprot:jgi/Undpi1/14251/HiC_scaffold_9.g03900.m1
MVLPASRLHAIAAAVAVVAGTSSSILASAALELTASDCAGFAALPTGAMTEDVNLFLDDAVAFTCDEVTTVEVDGPFEFRVTSDNFNVAFTNIRFDITGGANFTLNLAVEEFMGNATFNGITGLAADGGVFYVESGSSATFMVPMSFEDNSLTAGYSGAAVYAGGNVEFRYKAQFKGNKALRDGDYDAGDGGGLCVASRGEVSFDDHSYFTENEAESGGSGGAIANYGYLAFKRASYLTLNVAKENGDETGGFGGAIYTALGSSTVFERRAIMQYNTGASGGALFNEGTTTLESAGFIRGNKASGTDRADGGHIYTSGMVAIAGDVNFREGSATDGGAVNIGSGGSLVTSGIVTYIDNDAHVTPGGTIGGRDDILAAGFDGGSVFSSRLSIALDQKRMG